RVAALFGEAAEVARRCGDRQALYAALVRQNTAAIGHGCSASRFPERRRLLDEIASLAGDAYDSHEYLAWGFGPAAAFLEMGDGASYVAALTHFREYASKHRISTFEWGLASADAMRAILLGEFAEADRLADRALEIGRDVQGELATGVYGVQMFTIRREQGRLA